MTEYEFILRFRLPDPRQDPGKLVGALARAGCDDATLGIGLPGRIALDFTRSAPTAIDAVVSAVRAVRRAIPGAELVEAAPDLVGLTDVAELMGCSRQNVRKLMTSNPATFPAAVHEGALSLWHLRPVLDWFRETQKRDVDRRLIEVADVTMKLNIAKEAWHLEGGGMPKDIAALFA